MPGFEERRRLLTEMLRRDGIIDERVLAAFQRTPRENFVPDSLVERAYENVALPIGHGQTISQPYVVALMSQSLGLTGRERVLEIGTGSGYQAAILAQIAEHVISVERIIPLLETATSSLGQAGLTNVELHQATSSVGWPAGRPYDRIIVTAAGPSVPPPLLDQLAPGGRLVMPVGSLSEQRLLHVQRTEQGFEEADLCGVRFVPLVGDDAWSESSLAERAAGETAT